MGAPRARRAGIAAGRRDGYGARNSRTRAWSGTPWVYCHTVVSGCTSVRTPSRWASDGSAQ
jgi:hypothetical protein